MTLQRQHDVGLRERVIRVQLPVLDPRGLSVGVHLDVKETARAALDKQLGRAAKNTTATQKTPQHDRKPTRAKRDARERKGANSSRTMGHDQDRAEQAKIVAKLTQEMILPGGLA